MDETSSSSEKKNKSQQSSSTQQRIGRALRTASQRPLPGDPIHPALIPGIDVEETNPRYSTNRIVFVVALLATIGVVAWAAISPEHINETGVAMQEWVVAHFGWLFGTATSLGIGALQISTGTSILTGEELEGNTFVIIAMTVLTVIFVISAVTGIKKGIRMLSNLNMGLVIFMAAFVLAVGPTVFLLDLMPTSVLTFFSNLPEMLAVTASDGETEREFVTTWTVMYWA